MESSGEHGTAGGGSQETDDGTEPYAGFGGRVGRTVAGSEPWWPRGPSAPPGAPNVVVMLVDDLGFSDLGCYGSEISTPNLDGLAERGVRASNFHVTPMCSPTRAALLTGLNSHAAGVGHVAHSDSGFPGYAMEIAANAATAAEIFRDNGYSTFMVGKWHLTKDSHCSDAGPRDSWPCQRGFDRFYGFLDGFTNLHHPHRLVSDNTAVDVDRYPDGYYLTDDLTERAIEMIRSGKAADPTKPFFCYFAHGAVHAPLHAKAADIAKYADRYHGGWDRLREERHARLVELGLVADGTALPPRNSEPANEVVPWDSLTDQERAVYARYMAVYAAMVDNIDQNFGRLHEALDELGELDNTIILFTSDNGASREGEVEGTTAYYVHLLGDTDVDADFARLDQIGGPRTIPHYPRGWAMACNTPFRLYKINTHAGGHQVPMILSWPDGIAQRDELRSQYLHVTDVLPTLLDLCGIEAPRQRNGRALKPMAGTSFAAVLGDATAPSGHSDQYYEMLGHRGYYREGWEVVTLHQPMTAFGDHEWELYDLSSDPTETMNLASQYPELTSELAAAWNEAAWANQVFPLDEGSGLKYLQRPPGNISFSEPVTILAGTPTLERWRSQRLITSGAFTITARTTHEATDEGVLVAHGDQGGGYVLYLENGRLHYAHNDGRGRVHTLPEVGLEPGEHEINLAFSAPDQNRWPITLSVDGEHGSEAEGFPYLFPMAPFEGIDVGIDRRSPVSWELYERRGPFPYTGAIESVTYAPEDPSVAMAASILPILREMGAKYE